MIYLFRNIKHIDSIFDGWSSAEIFPEEYLSTWLGNHNYTIPQKESWDYRTRCYSSAVVNEKGFAEGFLYHANSLEAVITALEEFKNK